MLAFDFFLRFPLNKHQEEFSGNVADYFLKVMKIELSIQSHHPAGCTATCK